MHYCVRPRAMVHLHGVLHLRKIHTRKLNLRVNHQVNCDEESVDRESSCPRYRGEVGLSIPPNRHEITVLLPNQC